jgi:hypothetical protein
MRTAGTLSTSLLLCSLSSVSASKSAAQVSLSALPDDKPAASAPSSTGAAPASATPPPGAAQPHIQPPRPLVPLGVTYPESATGEHRVLLQLLIDADGRVAKSEAAEGEEPFTSVAIAASRQWMFTPAVRNGVRMPARIQLEVSFAPPENEPGEVAPPVQVSPAGDAVQPSGPPPDAEPVEVTVVGEQPPDVKRLGRAEVRQMPGAFGDPFRAIEALPGVTPIASGLPYFFIRGAPPGNVGYYFDQIPVPLLFHAALGPGVIHPAFIQSVNLYSGAYPAHYGRYAGGIVEGQAANPEYKLRGEATLRIVDAGAFLEVPFNEGRGSVMVGGRYSYTGLIVSLLAPEVNLGYWDYQAKGTTALANGDEVSLFAFGSHDFVQAVDDQGNTVNVIDLTFHRAQAKYRRVLSKQSALDISIQGGLDRTGLGGEDAGDEPPADVRGKLLGARLDFVSHLSPTLSLRAGLDTIWTRSKIELNTDDEDDDDGSGDDDGEPRIISPRDFYEGVQSPVPGFPSEVLVPLQDARELEAEQTVDEQLFSRDDVVSGAWLGVSWKPVPSVTVTPGLRFDAYNNGGDWTTSVDPRLTARYELTPKWAMIHTVGIAHQPPSLPIPIPGFTPSASAGLQTAVQSSAGTEVKLPEKLFASVTGFQNVTLNSTDVLSTASSQVASPETNPFSDRTTAHAYGFEFYLRRSLTERLGGFLSYTWSRSWRSVDYANAAAGFDRRHVLNLALAFDLGANWRLGSRLVTYSGVPAQVAYVSALKSPPRSPWYYRIDWRLEKRWLIGERGAWLSAIAEVVNTTLNRETIASSCYAFGCENNTIGPVTIPSLGLEASF